MQREHTSCFDRDAIGVKGGGGGGGGGGVLREDQASHGGYSNERTEEKHIEWRKSGGYDSGT